MSTIWDRAVRALQPVFRDIGGAGVGPTDQLAYYCGGPVLICDHRACKAVSALAEADLLHYADEAPAPVDSVHSDAARHDLVRLALSRAAIEMGDTTPRYDAHLEYLDEQILDAARRLVAAADGGS